MWRSTMAHLCSTAADPLLRLEVTAKPHESLGVHRRIPSISKVRQDAIRSHARFRQGADRDAARLSPGLSPCKAVASRPWLWFIAPHASVSVLKTFVL